MAERDVVFRVKRYRPESGGKPTYQEYRIPYRDDMVVLDGLNYIKDQVDPTKEFVQYPEDVEAYRQQSLCINCMLCYAACPVFGASPEFVGPAASALALRYIRDTRDEGADQRLARLNTKSGVWECTFVGECSVVCPKNVDPAAAIQTLKVLATMRHMRRLLTPRPESRRRAGPRRPV